MRASKQTNHCFDPETLTVLYAAFDQVWDELAPQVAPALHIITRNLIATTIVQAAGQGERDPERLGFAAAAKARALAKAYRQYDGKSGRAETQPSRQSSSEGVRDSEGGRRPSSTSL